MFEPKPGPTPQKKELEIKAMLSRFREGLIARFRRQIGHTNPFLRNSMVVAYGRGLDDMMKTFAELAYRIDEKSSKESQS